MTDNYAVIGNPVAHSKSPLIHAAFAEQTGEDLRYGRLLGNLEDFAGDVRDFLAAGGLGLNVTLPFKEYAYRLADEVSERADAARAVNTLIKLKDGRLCGDNTDGAGLINDLVGNHGFQFRGTRVLLLGAGGAARGVLCPLLEAGPANLVVANRTAARAKTLVAELTHLGDSMACGLTELAGQRFDLVINATAAGLGGQNPSLPDDCLTADAWIYDMLYGNTATPFVLWGRKMGAAKALDGIGMLVEQAAESFYLWRGVRPDTAPIIARLRNA